MVPIEALARSAHLLTGEVRSDRLCQLRSVQLRSGTMLQTRYDAPDEIEYETPDEV